VSLQLGGELTRALAIGALVWARVSPLFVVVPYLAWGAAPGPLPLALSIALAFALWPLCASAAVLTAPAFDLAFVQACTSELVCGSMLALGVGLPFAALRMPVALLDVQLREHVSAAHSGGLCRAFGLLCVAVAAGADLLSGVCQVLLSDALPPSLGSLAAVSGARAQLWSAVMLLLRAFGLGVSLCAPLFLGALGLAFALGLCARIAPAWPVRLRGAMLAPWLLLGLVCAAEARILAALPELLRAFVQAAARDLSGIP